MVDDLIKEVGVTGEFYKSFEDAYNFYNEHLFDGQLPPCLITTQRKSKRVLGYYSEKKFIRLDGPEQMDELALNPVHFMNQTTEETLSVLVKNMVMVWQYHFGQPSRKGYHNKQWAEAMESVGLCPSEDGEEGGKQTGQKMSHYIIQDGAFDRATKQLLDMGFKIPWGDYVPPSAPEDIAGEQGQKPPKTVTYTCPECALTAKAAPFKSLGCGGCQVWMEDPDGNTNIADEDGEEENFEESTSDTEDSQEHSHELAEAAE